METQVGPSSCKVFVFYSVRLTNQTSNSSIKCSTKRRPITTVANISIVTQSRVVFRYFSCINLTFLRSTGVLCQSWFLESGNRTTETNSNYFRGKLIYGETLWSSQNEQETGKLLQEWVSPEHQGKGSRKPSTQLQLELPVRTPPSLQPPCLPLKTLLSGP